MSFLPMILIICLCLPSSSLLPSPSHFGVTASRTQIPQSRPTRLPLNLSPVSLPDSLADSASIAASSTLSYFTSSPLSSARIDFFTNVGDETYTTLKNGDPFMKELVTCLARVTAENKNKPLVRVYFPDEGSAALTRRDWDFEEDGGETNTGSIPCNVVISSIPPSGFPPPDISKDSIAILNCPKASESESAEALLDAYRLNEGCMGVVMLNPNLVDMGVTGYGMAGRMYFERVIKVNKDFFSVLGVEVCENEEKMPLSARSTRHFAPRRFIILTQLYDHSQPMAQTYYLKTYYNGAVTYSSSTQGGGYTVWKEDADADGGYSLVDVVDAKPTDIDAMDCIEAGAFKEDANLGPLDALADFVNGMMRL
ncbi:hypothetical protein TL16_g03479 [Triparma laevis f. inornata]|uniref:DUF1995 domain-containing protein n=1 Tax=Triparma laevis f. inornata TaxID=1714386 RepID=A0A9W7A3Y9_9STRA|nr:hypothetical protein TL16_g03479 [Triparma laevis f. inornata]